MTNRATTEDQQNTTKRLTIKKTIKILTEDQQKENRRPTEDQKIDRKFTKD